jgi:hypothetical protein
MASALPGLAQPTSTKGITMSNTKDPFVSIEDSQLETVAGGAARVASGGSTSDSNDQLLTMLTSIGNSIKDLAANKNSGGGDQMMQMMMMMMMMGGMGGGGGGGVVGAPPVAQQPTYVDVSSSGGGCGRGGKKGW